MLNPPKFVVLPFDGNLDSNSFNSFIFMFILGDHFALSKKKTCSPNQNVVSSPLPLEFYKGILVIFKIKS